MKSIMKMAIAMLVLSTSVAGAEASGFSELVKAGSGSNQSSCVVKKATAVEFFTLKEIFPNVIYNTPGRDAGSAQLFQPIKNIAEPLARLGTQCLARNRLITALVQDSDSGKSCSDFKTWVELMVDQDALRFDRDKHRASSVSFVTGTLSGNLTIGPIAMYVGALRDSKLVTFKDDHAVDAWLKSRVSQYDNVPSKLKPESAQNLVLHSVLAKLMVGVATSDDQAALSQAEAIYKLYMDTARSDGSFPKESNRGISALKYENMTITSLLMLAELAFYRGKDLYSYKSITGVDIHKAVEFFQRAYRDESLITDYASENHAPTDKGEGTSQVKTFAREHMGWVPMYLRRFPTSSSQAGLKAIATAPGVRLSGVYDENLGAISGCIW